MRLKTKITLGLLALYSVLLALYFLLIYPYIYQELLKQEEEKINYYTKSVVVSLNNYIKFIKEDIIYISELNSCKEMKIDEIKPLFTYFLNRFSYIISYSLYNQEGQLISSVDKGADNPETDNHFILSVNNPIFNLQNQVIGSIQGEFLFDDNNIVNNNWILEPENYQWNSLLTNKSGFLIYHSNFDADQLTVTERDYSQYPSVTNALLGKWGLTRIKLDKAVWYSSSEFIPDVDWIFIVEIPRSIILQKLGLILLPINALIIVLLSLIFILIIILCGKLIKPLQVLTNTLSQYGHGANVLPIKVKASSEVNEAIKAFNRMLEERDQLEKEVLDITEAERRRIGLDLHDDLGQILTGIAFQTVMLEEDYQNNKMADITCIREISNLISEAIKKTKMIARGLCPVNLFDNGLMVAVEDFMMNIEKLYRIQSVIKNNLADSIKDDIICISLFNIIKEAVNNSLKYSKAHKIEIYLLKESDDLVLKIQDDGTGFEPGRVTGGLGLRTMRYRAKLINGQLGIQSGLGIGTVVSCVISSYFKKTEYIDNNAGLVI